MQQIYSFTWISMRLKMQTRMYKIKYLEEICNTIYQKITFRGLIHTDYIQYKYISWIYLQMHTLFAYCTFYVKSIFNSQVLISIVNWSFNCNWSFIFCPFDAITFCTSDQNNRGIYMLSIRHLAWLFWQLFTLDKAKWETITTFFKNKNVWVLDCIF